MFRMVSSFQHKSIDDIYLNISHFLDHFIMLIFAKAAYGAAKYFEISFDKFIVYGVFGFVLFGGMAPIAAYLADKFSRSLLMVVFHFGIGLSAIIAGLSSSPIQLAISIGFIGLFASIYHPVAIAMLIKSNKKIGFRLGINGVYGNMGVAAAPLITGIILTFGDWSLCFILPGVFSLIYGIVFSISLKTISFSSSSSEKVGAESFAPNWFRVLIALIITTSSGGFIFGSMTFFVPRYFEISMTNISASVLVTGILASLVYAVASFSQIGVGWLVDRFSPKIILFVIGIGQCFCIFLAANFTDLSLFFIMIFAMGFVFGQIPITDTILSRYVPDNYRSKVLSVKFLLNLTIGALVLPISSIMLQSGLPLSALFSIMSAVSVLIVLSALILPHQDKAERLDLK